MLKFAGRMLMVAFTADVGRNRAIYYSESLFTVLFTIEALVKIIAMGFWGKHGYMADKWHWLDLTIVIMGAFVLRATHADARSCFVRSSAQVASSINSLVNLMVFKMSLMVSNERAGYASLLPTVDNLSAFRSLRVLRPLRTLNAISGLRVVLSAIVNSVAALAKVGFLVVISVFVFTMLGLELWSGVLRGRCAFTDPFIGGQVVQEETFCAMPCSDFPANSFCTPTYGDACGAAIAYGYIVPGSSNISNSSGSSGSVPDFVSSGTAGALMWAVRQVNTTCVNWGNPGYGTISWDNFGTGFLNSYTIITTEGWSSILYYLWHTWGLRPVASGMFVTFIVFTSWLLLQLGLAGEAHARSITMTHCSESS